MNNRVIFHLDLNYFFCRCEEIINPQLEKLPFAVGSIKKRSVISTSNKVARQYDVKSAMKFLQATRLCPELIIIDLHPQLYDKKSHEFFECIKRYFCDEIEIMSIDECFLDVTNLLPLYHDNYEILAYEIIKKVKQVTNLYVTVGVGSNKFLAKMAGDSKPLNGISTIFIDEIKQKLWPLSIEKVFMIGTVTCKILQSLGIYKVIDFIQYDNHHELEMLLKTKRYNTIMQNCLGGTFDEINYHDNISKSISSSRTFMNDTNDIHEINAELNHMARILCQELNHSCLYAQTFSITIKYNYVMHASKSITLKKYIDKHDEIKLIFIELFNKLWNEEEIRGLSIAVSKLSLKTDFKHQIELDFYNK